MLAGLATVVVLVLLGWALSAWLLPWVVRTQGEKRLGELLGRTVTIARVETQLTALTVTLHGVAIAGSAPGQPLFSVQRLHADLAIASLWQRGWVVQSLAIDAPRLQLARTAPGHYDIDDVLARIAALPPKPPEAEPVRFALHDLTVQGGELRFDDKPAATVHQLRGLSLTLPFLSNLPSDVSTAAEPRLAFELNGARFDSGASATPFSADRAGTLRLHIGDAAGHDIDLAPYRGYLPASVPVKLVRGRLGGTVELRFAQPAGSPPDLRVQGELKLREFALTDGAERPLAEGRELVVPLRELRPLARAMHLGAIRSEGLQLTLARQADGRLRLPISDTAAAQPSPAPAIAASAPASSDAPPPWQIALDGVALRQARLNWRDEAVQPAFDARADDLALTVGALQWPLKAPVPIKLEARVNLAPAASGSAAPPPAMPLQIDGTAGTDQATLHWRFSELALQALQPYTTAALAAPLQGTAAAEGRLDWVAGDAPKLALQIAEAEVERLRLGSEADALTLERITLQDAAIDLAERRVRAGTLALASPSFTLARDGQGRWNVDRWKAAAPPSAAPAASAPAAPSAGPAVPSTAWRLALDQFKVDGGRLQFSDQRPRIGDPGERVTPARLAVSGLAIDARRIAWGEASAAPAQLQVTAYFGDVRPPAGRGGDAGKTTPGSDNAPRVRRPNFEWQGEVTAAPVRADGTLTVRRFPLEAFKGYFDNPLRIDLARAAIGYTGKLSVNQQPAGWRVGAQGDVRIADVSVRSLPGEADAPGTGATPDELLGWQRLSLNGFDLQLAPGAVPSVSVAQAEFADLYTRLVITPEGRLNLRDVGPAPAAGTATPAAPATATTPASAPPALDIRIASTQLQNGRIDFADRFVKPNYSAALTELNGSLGTFASGSTEMAALNLRGRAEGSALLEIDGRLNPTAHPLALDIHAKATDLELAPLSPYAGKYAGYEIERGKLSMDVRYKIEPDGRLEASNQLVLNQLSFGDKVESASATTLPVRLAVALLQDSRGVIDLNLPISGSLNDPQFSVGSLIGKALGNLLLKAVTSPFSLLRGSGDGGPDVEAQHIAFVPGTARFTEGQTATLTQVAEALVERPALKMTVTGEASLQREAEVWQVQRVEQQIAEQLRRERVRAGASAATPVAPDASPPPIAPADRSRILQQLYSRADLPDKPRNLLGLAETLPDDQALARLARSVPATPEALRELALQRGLAVRDALIAQGLGSERLFLAAPRIDAEGDGARATLDLSVD